MCLNHSGTRIIWFPEDQHLNVHITVSTQGFNADCGQAVVHPASVHPAVAVGFVGFTITIEFPPPWIRSACSMPRFAIFSLVSCSFAVFSFNFFMVLGF